MSVILRLLSTASLLRPLLFLLPARTACSSIPAMIQQQQQRTELGVWLQPPPSLLRCAVLTCPLRYQIVDYWFAGRHLQELINAREADTVMPN
eukprot:1830137-Rhodomonas_salina.3